MWLALASVFAATSLAAAEQYWIYNARPGDTLASLAEEYCTDSAHWRRIQQLNNLHPDPDRTLAPGTRLQFPLDILKHEPAVCRVVQLHGSAQVIRAGSNVPEALETGAPLRSGDRVITGPDSNITLHFADGSQLLILGNSEVLMDNLSAWSTTGMVDTRLRLQGGRVETRVQPVRGPGSRYQIITPAAVAAVRGTEFRVAAHAEQAIMHSEVTGGAVSVSAADSDIAVVAGYGLVSTAGQAAQEPRALLPKPDLSSIATQHRRLPVRFSWPPIDGAKAYRFQIAPDAGFQTLLEDQLVTQTMAEWPHAVDGSYAVRVRGIDAVGLEGLDAVRTFRVNAQPFAPVPATPAADALLRDATPELSWQTSRGGERYRLQLARDEAFQELVADITLTRNSFKLTDTLQPGRHYWRVAAIDSAARQGLFSTPISFTYRAPLLAPKPGAVIVADQQLDFDWQTVNGASTYQLQIASDPDFSDIVHRQEVSEPHAQVRRLPPQHYWYRVRALHSDGEQSAFSVASEFDVQPRHYWPLLLPLLPLLLLL